MTDLKSQISEYILALGFDDVGFTAPKLTNEQIMQRNQLSQEQCGDMQWLWDSHDIRNEPLKIFPKAQTAIIVASHLGQNPDDDRYRALKSQYNQKKSNHLEIAQYAKAQKDYHIWIKKDLKKICRFLHENYGAEARPYVDTAPIAERALAANAGLGWIGKNSLLISPLFGAKLMLGVILTDLDITKDVPLANLCGRCTRCQKACPTKALDKAYQLDIPRCVSYQTIEHKGDIAKEIASLMGNHFFGCDECSAACPYNKNAPAVRKPHNMPRIELEQLKPHDFLSLSEEDFRHIFRGTGLKRAGYKKLTQIAHIILKNQQKN